MPRFTLFRKKTSSAVDTTFDIQKVPTKDMKTYPLKSSFQYHMIGEELKKFVQEINEAITLYNQLQDPNQKLSSLHELQTKIKIFESKYPPEKYFGHHKNMDYWNFQKDLHEEITYQYASMGKSPVSDTKHESPLAIVIATMSARKVQKFFSILEEGENVSSKLKKLYPEDDLSEEAIRFRRLLKTHEISYLGGYNSKNYKVTQLGSDKPLVLKVENRMEMPKAAETHLRNQESLKSLFTPIATERLTYSEHLTGSLQVVEFAPGGSLYEDSEQLSKHTKPLVHTAEVFAEMAQGFSDIHKAGGVFTDGKFSNWLKGKNLGIADTKSLLFHKDGVIQQIDNGMLATPGFTPPEFSKSTCHAGPFHSYILGKNLYFYLTNKNPLHCNLIHEGRSLAFTNDIFKTEEGKEYKTLIMALVKEDPNKRMPVEEALLHFKYLQLRSELKEFTFGENDKAMNKFLKDMQYEFKMANTQERKAQILEQMNTTLNAFKGNEVLVELKNIAHRFHEKSNLFNGMKQKAERIEDSLSQVSLEDRMKSNYQKPFNNAIRELASHRSLFSRGKIHEKEGVVDENKAAQSFKDFKEKFKDNATNTRSQEDKNEQQADQLDKNTIPRMQ